MYDMQTLHAGGIPMFRGTYLVYIYNDCNVTIPDIGLARNDTSGCAFHQNLVCNPMFCNVPNAKIGKNRVWFLEIGCAKHTLYPWLANALQ